MVYQNSSGINVSGIVRATGTGGFSGITLTDGQLIIGSTAGAPAAATLTAGSNITITNAANSITIASTGGSSALTITTVNNAASPYTVLAADQYLAVDTSGGAVTLRFPNTTTTGRVLYVKDSKGTAGTSNITITTVGGTVTFDGSTSVTINTAYRALNVIFDGTNYQLF